MSAVATAAPSRLALAALVFNAFTYGLSWWPFRELAGRGLHALWVTVLMYAVAAAVVTVWRPAAWGQLARTPVLWVLVLASGTTNAAFNWAVTIGDVVRVVLLFYLMPVWATLLARALLGERITPAAALRVALALAGAAVVLWPEGSGAAAPESNLLGALPLPRAPAEWLGVLGGFAFALNNVMLRREAHRPDGAKALAMFVGGSLVAGTLAVTLAAAGRLAWPPGPAAWGLLTALLGLWFLAGNLALQYGAARVRAQVTAVVMVSEVLFAAVSAVALGASVMTPALLAGGALIVAASLLAARG